MSTWKNSGRSSDSQYWIDGALLLAIGGSTFLVIQHINRLFAQQAQLADVLRQLEKQTEQIGAITKIIKTQIESTQKTAGNRAKGPSKAKTDESTSARSNPPTVKDTRKTPRHPATEPTDSSSGQRA